MQYITLFGMPHPLCNLFERYFKFIMHQGIRVPGSYLFQHALKFKCRLFIQMLYITLFGIPHRLCNLFERYFKFIMHQGSYLFQHALKFKCRLFIQMLVIKTIFKIMVLTFLRICELSVAKVMAKLRKHMHVCM